MVDAAAFEDALSRLVLDVPLTLGAPEQGWLVRASYPGDVRAPGLMGKGFGGRCKAGQRATCLSLLDFMGMSERDRLMMALGFSLEPLEASISAAVKKTLAPELFYGLIATGIISWIVLAANPEPVFTKAAAIVSALVLIYLGVEMFLEVLEASRELKRASDEATRFEELQQAGERFASRVGPQVARVFVLAVTVAVTHGMAGGAGWMASRVSLLPRFTEAALAGGSGAGINLAHAGEVSAVTVVGSTVIISLPASAIAAVAMEAQGDGDSAAEESGQLHHVISKRIAEALEKHDALRGHYSARDPRFVTRAANKNSHNGYQQWHRDVDQEVTGWLRDHGNATPEEFEAHLREIYNRPPMRARFPNGF